MRRIIVGVVTTLLTVGALPGLTSASNATRLVDGMQRALIGMTESDPWLFDDGCTGGKTAKDPVYMLVPNSETPTTQSKCTVRFGAPIVISAAAFTCWDVTLELATESCETAWADPAQALLDASVKVDGKVKRLYEFRVSGKLTFPEGAILDVPGTETNYHAITDAVIVTGLRPGVHTVNISFEFADGFAGQTTFKLTVKPAAS